MKKKLLALTLAALMALSLAACGGDTASTDTEAAEDEAAETAETSGQVYNIGICQLAPHPALDAATEGFQDALTELLGDRVKFDLQNASGEASNCSTIVCYYDGLKGGTANTITKARRRDLRVINICLNKIAQTYNHKTLPEYIEAMKNVSIR